MVHAPWRWQLTSPRWASASSSPSCSRPHLAPRPRAPRVAQPSERAGLLALVVGGGALLYTHATVYRRAGALAQGILAEVQTLVPRRLRAPRSTSRTCRRARQLDRRPGDLRPQPHRRASSAPRKTRPPRPRALHPLRPGWTACRARGPTSPDGTLRLSVGGGAYAFSSTSPIHDRAAPAGRGTTHRLPGALDHDDRTGGRAVDHGPADRSPATPRPSARLDGVQIGHLR